MILRAVFFATLAFLPISTPPSLTAAEWFVDASVAESGDGTTPETAFEKIQQGIDAASDGDTVIVAQGTYVENIHFDGKNIVLTSTEPLDPDVVANTIIDGDQSDSVVTFLGMEDETCTLSGFTICNGLFADGGGICGEGTLASIGNNVITDNWGDRGGGLYRCDGTVQRNTIVGNSAVGSGGGAYCCGGTIRNNVIAENSAGCGGGLNRCDGTIQNNTIVGNSGGGLCMCEGILQNNVITANLADHGSGGGLYDCFGTVANNTVIGNSAGSGGGLYGCDAAILNCIIWGNAGSWVDPQLCSSRTPVYSCVQDWTQGGEGNIGDDPCFAGPDTGDFRLLSSSPCIDAGYNDPALPATDIAGMHRITYGGKSPTVDMGAYEYYINRIEADASGDITLTWSSVPVGSYTVWSCADLRDSEWTKEATVPSEGPVTSWVDVRPHDTTEFYKVEIGYGSNTFITVFNDTPWDVFIEPFGLFLAPGEVVDIEVGYEVSHVVARRDFHGLILAEVDMPPGDVLVIQ